MKNTISSYNQIIEIEISHSIWKDLLDSVTSTEVNTYCIFQNLISRTIFKYHIKTKIAY